MKKCPYCGEEIQDTDVTCEHCGRDLIPANPISAPHVSKKNKITALWISIAVLFILILAAAIIASISNGHLPTTAIPFIPGVATSSSTTLPVPTSASTGTLAPTPKPFDLGGSGDLILDMEYPWSPGAILDITYTGTGDFNIISLDENGDNINLIANSIGPYIGRRMIDASPSDQRVRRLKISASGNWSIKVSPLTMAGSHLCNAGDTCKGTGDDIVAIGGNPDQATVKYSGTGGFIIIGYGLTGIHILVDEKDSYSGTIPIPNGTFLLEIDSKGPWKMAITSK